VNGYVYRTDEAGRISEVSGQLDLRTADRNTGPQGRAGRQGVEGDEGGHIITSIFNGPGEMVNLYPQNGNFNRGVWKQLETTWADALREGKSVEVRIQLRYGDDGVRPDRLSATYSIAGGRPETPNFDNAPGGAL
jgi:filamentous hemagglutinin